MNYNYIIKIETSNTKYFSIHKLTIKNNTIKKTCDALILTVLYVY